MNIDNITSDSMTLTYNGKAMLIKVYEQEIERLKEQLNDEIDDELKQSEIMVKQQNEIERLTLESTKWESKFYDEAKKVDKAIEFIIKNENNISSIKDLENNKTYNSALLSVKDILQGSDKE